MSTNTSRTSEPVIIASSILAGLQMFLGGATTVSIVAEHYLVAQLVALGMLAVGAAQAGVGFYVRGQVVPVDAVVERVDGHGQVIAGPANTLARPGDVVRRVEADPVVAEAGGSAVD